MAWAALLKAEAILTKEPLLPLPTEVVNSLSHVPVNCLLWKQRWELGFSAHKTGSEQAKWAMFAGGSKKHHWAVFPGKVGGKKSPFTDANLWFWDLQEHRKGTLKELPGNEQILKGWWGAARTWRAAQKQRMLSPNGAAPALPRVPLWSGIVQGGKF